MSYGTVSLPAYADSDGLGPDRGGEGFVHIGWRGVGAEWVDPADPVTLPDPRPGADTCGDCLGTLLCLDVDPSITGDPGCTGPVPLLWGGVLRPE